MARALAGAGVRRARTARATARRVLSGPRPPLRSWPRLAARRGRGWGVATRGHWRRSLLLRVVAATVALGLVVVGVVGQFLVTRIGDGLIESRMASAINESKQLFDEVNQSYKTVPYNDVAQFARDMMNTLEGHETSPLRYVVLMKALSSNVNGPIQDGASGGIDRSAIPDDLREAVNNDQARQHGKLITALVRESGDAQPHPVSAIAVGCLFDFNEVAGGKYELYLIYRLDREAQILDLVRRTLIVGGIALVLLVGAVAWVVTRQVVAPVRQAARTAEELSSGRLDRRMQVHGEDELARLARAFNRMASSLERQIHELEELSRVQRRFVSDVSHELRTPLTTIRMAGEVMFEARAAFEPAIARSSELLHAQIDRFEALLSDLLEVSRFDAGAAVLDLDTVDLRDVVTQTVEGLRPLVEQRGLVLQVRMPHPAQAELDPRRIARVVRNLLGNAIEHAEGRPITIRVAADEQAVAVSVRDRGVGLDPAEQSLVFNRFWRGDPARARTTGGTGLGLAIALEDAHLHGGWLQVWGERGAGANFRLTLPRRRGTVLLDSPLPLVPPEAVAAPAALRSGAEEPGAADDPVPVPVPVGRPVVELDWLRDAERSPDAARAAEPAGDAEAAPGGDQPTPGDDLAAGDPAGAGRR